MDIASIHVTRWGSSGPRVILVHGGSQGSARGGEHSFSGQKSLGARGWERAVLPASYCWWSWTSSAHAIY